MLEGFRKPTELIVTVVTLLAYGCPLFTPMDWMNGLLPPGEIEREVIVNECIMPSSNKGTWTSCMSRQMKFGSKDAR